MFKIKIDNYIESLIKTYIVYSLSLVLSTLLNHVLVNYLGVPPSYAFPLGLAGTGVINYFTVKDFALADKGEGKKEKKRA